MAGKAMLAALDVHVRVAVLSPAADSAGRAGDMHGTMTFAVPTDLITEPIQELTHGGQRFVFMLAPGTEAPSEMLIHVPDRRALCAAEDATHTLHNLYTLRGAKVRDARAWSYYLDKAIDQFADDTDVIFAQHHWPTWGSEVSRVPRGAARPVQVPARSDAALHEPRAHDRSRSRS